jgi:hypothetical protein
MITEMDDLHGFREIWENLHEKSNPERKHSDTDQIIRQRSMSAVSRFKRSLLIELWIGILVLVSLPVAYLLYPGLQYGSYLIILFLLMLGCVYYYYVQYENLKLIEPLSDTSVKTSITQTLHWMKRFVRAYLRLNQVLFAFCLMILQVIFLNSTSNRVFTVSGLSPAVVLLIMISVTVVATLIVYPLQKLYIRWMIGRFLNSLEENLKELENNSH